jgi:hypothetical protein
LVERRELLPPDERRELEEPLPLRDDDEPLLRDEPLPLPLREPELREPELRDDDEPPLRAEPLPLRDAELREDEPRVEALRELELREPLLREDEPLDRVRELPPEARELLRERVDVERRRDAERRSDAGISSVTTAFTSCGISFSRNLNMRSSSRRMVFAIFAVSLSPTAVASASIAL